MKKTFLLIFVILSACAGLFAGEKEYVADKTINVLQGYATMEMDMVSFGDTVYEAVLGMNHTDLSKGTPIFINKYIGNRYNSTLKIDVEGFDNYEFKERYSHYDFLKLYALGPNEIVLTLYSAFSDNRFAFFRIKDDRVVAYKSYSLKNQSAYETQYYAFDGKDTVYVAFNGQVNFRETGWDLFLMSFDLNGNLKNSVMVYTNQNDELTGLAAFEDNVYLEIRRTFEKQAVVQLDSELNYKKIWACKYDGCDIRYIYLRSGIETAEGTFLVDMIMENHDESKSLDYLSRFTGDGEFICSYIIEESTEDNGFNYCKEKISDEGVLYFGHRTKYDPNDWSSKDVSFTSYFMDWDGNKLYEKNYRQHGDLEFKKYAFVDGKYFCSGENYYESTGISHIAYTYLVDVEPQDTDFVHIEKSSFNPLASPEDPELAEIYSREMEFWSNAVKVEPIEIPTWDFGYTIKRIRLSFRHINPLSKSITKSIPLFEFSEM
ncbi:MAG: hypothetical protein J5857_06930 [Treponema sp.]|nr:hypothetical protein [Treponema sp.]